MSRMRDKLTGEQFSRKVRDSGSRKVAENLQELRTAEEIALMNKREWTRALPPRPVLPPYGRLEKISGRLESFSSECFREYFGVEAYRNHTLPRVSGAQRGAGAAEAILAGSPAAGLLLADGSITNSDKNTAEYVQGSINGRPFRGWVGMTQLQTGDEVEMVAEWRDDHYEVYAIALPQERIISVCPRCDRGHIAEGWVRFRNLFILTAVLLSMVAFVAALHAYNNGPMKLDDYLIIGLMFLVMSLGLTGLMALSAYKAYAPTACRLAEEIFTVLGMEDVARINLAKITRAREKELKKKGLWYSPWHKDRPFLPTRKTFSIENWYYY
ncbi:putative type VI secretion system effector [Erwinia sp. V90_4]|uniref:putative type VI secretion system effector n=1 Tax=Erwinia sp. V90_4 TaxID=3044239 RepID=UPI00249E4CDB|nr:putative type VI secretion system effector [Erwinia sp. V90_4]MDI3439018.1 putative type VI secretion system effector [Erwinia sp. V90_4]